MMTNLHMMSNLDWAAVYAGVNILLLFVLALLVVGARRRGKVLIGDGGDAKLLQASRVHANATEYIPAGLVGLAILAVMNPEIPQWVIHAGGGLLTIGRIAHAFGLSMSTGPTLGRMLGTALTWTAFLFIAGALIWFGLDIRI